MTAHIPLEKLLCWGIASIRILV